MSSLKQLNKVVLSYALDSKCGGLALIDRLRGPKLRQSNPACDVSHEILPMGSKASLELKYTDNKTELIDITAMHSQEVFDAIERRVQERNTQEVLEKHSFVGKKLASTWGL